MSLQKSYIAPWDVKCSWGWYWKLSVNHCGVPVTEEKDNARDPHFNTRHIFPGHELERDMIFLFCHFQGQEETELKKTEVHLDIQEEQICWSELGLSQDVMDEYSWAL